MDFNTVVQRLEENKLPYEVVNLNDDAKIIVSQYGGRILGPFIGNGHSFNWINPCFLSDLSFRQFVENQEWNMGGDRVWLAPEMQFNVTDSTDFWGSYSVQTQLDPGNYRLNLDPFGQAKLFQNVTLKIHNEIQTEKMISIERMIHSTGNPFAKYLSASTRVFGYEHEITLEEAESDGLYVEAWNLLQFNPQGYLYIPTTSPAQFSEYYEPFEAGYQTIFPNYVQLKIDAQRRYKVGYKSIHTTGRSGYISRHEGQSYLMIRSFYNDMTGTYLKCPINKPEGSGNALHIYNDDGKIGQFAEHECSGLPIGGTTGRKRSVDRISTIFFVDEIDQLEEICRKFLGLELRLPQGT